VANPPRGEDGAAGRNLFFSLGVFEAGEYPHRRLRRLRFRTETPPSSPVKSFGVPWRELDTFLAARFVVGWTQGTIVALRTKNDRLFLLRVTQVKEMHLPDLEIGIEVLDWKERDAPRVGQLDSLKPCRSRKDPERTMSAIALGPVHAPERLSVVGYLPMSESTQRSGRVALEWGQLEEWLANDNPRL
jgi:hypothetical protein